MNSVTKPAQNVVITGKDDCSVIILDRLCTDFRLEGDSYVCKIVGGSITIVVWKGALTMTINGESLIFPEHTKYRSYLSPTDVRNFGRAKSYINTDLGTQRAANNRFRYG